MAKKYTVKLLRKEKLARDTWLFAFEKPNDYVFLPGQFQTFFLRLQNGNIDSRDMTIASSPTINELWIVTKIQKEDSDFKKSLSSLSIGENVSVQGPNGGFIIKGDKPHVFLAGGIGVTVFHSIMQYATDKKLKIPLTLFASFSKEEDMLFLKDFKKIENTNTKIIHTLTKESQWKGEKGRISEKLLSKYISKLNNNIFMIAGGQSFVDDMNTLLLQMGISSENIRIDYFTGY